MLARRMPKKRFPHSLKNGLRTLPEPKRDSRRSIYRTVAEYFVPSDLSAGVLLTVRRKRPSQFKIRSDSKVIRVTECAQGKCAPSLRYAPTFVALDRRIA